MPEITAAQFRDAARRWLREASQMEAHAQRRVGVAQKQFESLFEGAATRASAVVGASNALEHARTNSERIRELVAQARAVVEEIERPSAAGESTRAGAINVARIVTEVKRLLDDIPVKSRT